MGLRNDWVTVKLGCLLNNSLLTPETFPRHKPRELSGRLESEKSHHACFFRVPEIVPCAQYFASKLKEH